MSDRLPALQNYTRPAEGMAQQGAPGMYPEYTVGGMPYSRVSDDIPPWLEKGLTWGLSKAAEMRAANSGTAGNVYKQAVLDRRQAPFTERDFNQQDMNSLARAIVRSQAEGRNSLTRNDYVDDKAKWFDGPFNNVLGRANYTIDKAGNAVVNDTYDFNNYERGKGREDVVAAPIVGDSAAWLGRRALPSGVRGVPMQINVPHEMLESALSGFGMK